ncbi:hypothetical protein KSF_084930 [Reticulibacter mediterranei]|uniref:Uncharacterized protein n=1 Tax=Reticulibacter mediterranei TaxID=2778369 RepID=A0A8J3IX51_9CHLR|nr:hypothetical protein [Reticulibacter mediterranei]GHO98445.1 hypothetical protein KSF_084930 [Reticulibacter mediterranei]
MLLAQVALVPENEDTGISMSNLTRVAAALQKQVTRDFGPIWEIDATVDGFASLEDVPLGYWPILISKDAPDSALGFHVDEQGQPFSIVKFNANWSLTASHECLEMLADPFGNRLVPSFSLKDDQGRVSYLVEVCDPCESVEFAYTSNGILVSDFYTPDFFDPEKTTGGRYDFVGKIEQPRQVLDGGYISWSDPRTNEWWQQQFFGDRPQFVNLGKITGARNIREAIDKKTREMNLRPEVAGLPETDKFLKRAQQDWHKVTVASQPQASMLRTTIKKLKEEKQLVGV